MSAGQEQARSQWVGRVLGFRRQPGAPTPDGADAGGAEAGDDADFDTRWAAASAAWQAGVESVDKQIESLGKHLTASDDERLRDISETGLNAITGNHKVRFMAAIRDVSTANPEARAKAAAKAEQQLIEFLDHLTRDPRVEACDSNPFGVTVAVRDTLIPLLDRLDGLLGTAVAA